MSDKRVIEQRGLWFEEFEIGVRYLHRPGRTITEADNVLFTTLTMNTQALHLDAAFSDALPPFNARLVNSMFTLSTLVGLSVAQLTQGTIVGNLGFSGSPFPSRFSTATRSTPKRRSPRSAHPRAARGRHRHVRAHRAQPARRRRRDSVAQDHGAHASGRGGVVAIANTGPGWLFCPRIGPSGSRRRPRRLTW